MGKSFDTIPDFLFPWIAKQELFFVATAPLDASGHINISPKGVRGCFNVVDEKKVWYQDLTGSGVETISHLREPGNGRITIMLNAFEGPPQIVRLFGKGTVYEFGTPEYEALVPFKDRKPGSRAVIAIEVHKVRTSCGYAVPFYQFLSHRTRLLDFFESKEINDRSSHSDNGLKAYWIEKNLESLDGLPGLDSAPKSECTPMCEYDREKEGMKASTSPGGIGTVIMGRRMTWDIGNLKFIMGLMLGIWISAICMKIGEGGYGMKGRNYL